jgi:chromosome segregation ATPase
MKNIFKQGGRITAEQINAAANVANQFKNIVALADIIVEAGSLMDNEDAIKSNILALNQDVADAKKTLTGVEAKSKKAKADLNAAENNLEVVKKATVSSETATKRLSDSQVRDRNAHAVNMEALNREEASSRAKIATAIDEAKEIIRQANLVKDQADKEKAEANQLTKILANTKAEVETLEKLIIDKKDALKAQLGQIAGKL